ncbi:hypothetical protein Bbelb_395850 [Branchiostoma belcheri]|nr:hypothetical protein Bbelb_395850 [Branchiostoma belcheri]
MAHGRDRVDQLRWYVKMDTTVTAAPGLIAKEGDAQVVLTCQSGGIPAPTYTWTGDNLPADATQDPNTGTLTITNIQRSAAGQYTCTADNGVPQLPGDNPTALTNSVNVQVQYGPSSATITRDPADKVVQWSTVTLSCAVDTANPPATYTWTRVNGTLPTNTDVDQVAGTLRLRSIQPDAVGTYQCSATNRIGDPAIATHVIDEVEEVENGTIPRMIDESESSGSSRTRQRSVSSSSRDTETSRVTPDPRATSDEIFAETKDFMTRGQLAQHEKETESAIHRARLPERQAEALRNKVATTLKVSKPPASNITREERTALKDFATNQDILILPTDKGRCTVVLDREQYDRKNSADFVNKIKDIHVEEDETITSYDVCSLFTFIPPKEAVSVVREALETDDKLADRTNLSVDQIEKEGSQIDDNIKFTQEPSHDNMLPVLDTKTIVGEDGNLRFEVLKCEEPNCNDTYIGETSRPLKVRYKEHCRPSANGYSSAIYHHLQHNQGHSFKLESMDILDRETRWWERGVNPT